MNKLQSFIINSDIAGIRNIANNHKEWLMIKTDNNELPIELAKKKGIHRIEVAIARNIDFTQFYSLPELQKLLVNLISEISEDYFSAGWMDSIEYELWELLQSPKEKVEKDGFWWVRLNSEDLLDLKFLSEQTNSWAIWDDENDAITIPLD